MFKSCIWNLTLLVILGMFAVSCNKAAGTSASSWPDSWPDKAIPLISGAKLKDFKDQHDVVSAAGPLIGWNVEFRTDLGYQEVHDYYAEYFATRSDFQPPEKYGDPATSCSDRYVSTDGNIDIAIVVTPGLRSLQFSYTKRK